MVGYKACLLPPLAARSMKSEMYVATRLAAVIRGKHTALISLTPAISNALSSSSVIRYFNATKSGIKKEDDFI